MLEEPVGGNVPGRVQIIQSEESKSIEIHERWREYRAER
jgi:hypothetical protein